MGATPLTEVLAQQDDHYVGMRRGGIREHAFLIVGVGLNLKGPGAWKGHVGLFEIGGPRPGLKSIEFGRRFAHAGAIAPMPNPGSWTRTGRRCG